VDATSGRRICVAVREHSHLVRASSDCLVAYFARDRRLALAGLVAWALLPADLKTPWRILSRKSERRAACPVPGELESGAR
jgi:hypothetical protein